MKADIVRLHPVGPHRLHTRRPLIPIANTVTPVVSGDEVAAGPLEHLESCLLVEPYHGGMKSLHVIGRHQRSGPDVKRAAAGTEDFQSRILGVGRRSEI